MARTWTDDQRVEALTRLAANGGNVSQTSRELGIPRATIILWRDTVMPHMKPPPEQSGVISLADRGDNLAERVRNEIEHIAFGNLSDVVAWDGDGRLTLTPSDELTPRQAALVSEIRVRRRTDDEGVVTEDLMIKTRDKLGALKVLATATGVLPTPGGVSVTVDNRSIDLSGLSDDELRARMEAARALIGAD